MLPNWLSQAEIAQQDDPRRYRKAIDDYGGPVELSKEAGVEVIPQVHILPHLPHPLLHLPHHCLHLIVCWLGLSGSPSSQQLLEACAMTDQGS